MGLLDKLRGTGAPDVAPKAILAAAVPMHGPAVARLDRSRQQTNQDQWQNEAWYFYDAIGEVRGPLTWIANATSQADVHGTELDPDTGLPTGPTEDPIAAAAAAQFLGGPSQRLTLLKMIALCWQVVGEVFVIVRPQGAGKPDSWLALSGNKVRAKGLSWEFTDPFTGADITLGPTDLLIRVWSPHPNDQSRSDSAMRPALPICREIEKSSQNIAARLDSRLKGNGIYWVPEEVDYPRGDYDSSGEALMDLLLTTAEQSLQQPGTASAQVPIILTVPGEQIQNIRHDDLATEFDGAVVDLRTNGLARLGKTLDMPADVAEGTQGEANHWTSWKVEEDTYKIFIQPLLKAIGDAGTSAWYVPALKAMGMAPERAEQFELGWNTTAIVARPDNRETLESLYDKVLISDEYFLTENGVSADAMPDQTERTRRVLEKLVMTAPTLMADPNVAAALDLGIEVAPVAAGVDANVTAGGELEAPQPEPTNVRALPGTQNQEPDPQAVPEGLVAAAELIVYDALSRAGGRLLTNQNRGQFKATPRHELHTVIEVGTAWAPLMEGSLELTDPVADAFGLHRNTFLGTMRRYVRDRLRQGLPHDREALREDLRWVGRG